MKKLSLLLLVQSVFVLAQAPQKMSYQSVLRNSANELVVNQNIGVKISIIQSALFDTVVYTETHSATTNDNGLFTLEVGGGTALTGTFAAINWAGGSHYIKSQIDLTGGTNYTLEVAKELLSVPYALYSAKSANSDNAWALNGNTGTSANNFIGTTDSQNLSFRTNNTEIAKFTSAGQFLFGPQVTEDSSSVMKVGGTDTKPWALNGYSRGDGSGVYGAVESGTTNWPGVLGYYFGTGLGSGVKGVVSNNTSGVSYREPIAGVYGYASSPGNWKFGTYGTGGTSPGSGGVLGNDYGTTGALGYHSLSENHFSFYGVTNGWSDYYALGGVQNRISNNYSKENADIGIGCYGGVMGGWVRGMKFGFHTKGETYSLYVDGNGYTNKPLAYLIGSENQDKVASFMSTSLKPEVTVNGKVNLTNGRAFVPFDNAFQQIISKIDDVIITASPQGRSNGVYIDNITKNGFWIVENNDGVSNAKTSWIAITKIKGEENPTVPADLLAKDFDKKMEGVMFNDNNTVDKPQSVWWDGSKIRWDMPTIHKVDTETEEHTRPNEEKK